MLPIRCADRHNFAACLLEKESRNTIPVGGTLVREEFISDYHPLINVKRILSLPLIFFQMERLSPRVCIVGGRNIPPAVYLMIPGISAPCLKISMESIKPKVKFLMAEEV